MSGRERDLPIAVFDSGVGGLTVLHECLVSLPSEDYVYLGDTARFPYGDRSQEQLRVYALELADRLVDEGAKLLVIACNSATAAALPELRERLGARVPVVSVVTPESRLAAGATAQRPNRPHGHGRHGGERGLRPRPRRGGARCHAARRWPARSSLR